jgi:hypothetical protein
VFASAGDVIAIGLFVGNLVLVITLALYARAVSRDRRLAQRDLHVRAWHLRQLLPRQLASDRAGA